MTLQEEAILSYYKEIAHISSHENVCLVQHTETQRIYVKKVLTEYKREIYEMLRQQKFPCFPKIYELIESDGTLILIEEYINGSSLENLLEAQGTFSEQESVKLILQICGEIRLLHGQDPPVIHRDLKPSNIIMTEAGDLKIIDFNTSRYYMEHAAKDTVVLGTKAYAPPEQWGYGQTDVRSDIYALGVMLNVFLTGDYPDVQIYEGKLTPLIRKCTQFDPKNRYQTVEELMQALQAVDSEKMQDTIAEKTFNRNAERKKAHAFKRRSSSEDRTPGNTNLHKKICWLPPGYRTRRPWKIVLASVGYAGILWISCTLQVKDASSYYELIMNRIACLVMLLLWILLWFNYGNIHRNLPLLRKKGILWKLMGYGVYTVCIMFVVISILTFIT